MHYGQVYSTPARLLKQGLVEADGTEAGGGPERKRYAITEAGVADVGTWQATPEKPEAYLQNTLYTKVVPARLSTAGPRVAPQWTVPAVRRVAGVRDEAAALLVTPAALATASGVGLTVDADVPTADPDLVERVRNTVGWNGTVYSLGTESDGTYALITRALSVGSVLVLLFVAGSLLVAAQERLRERRRSLAALMASGVGRGVLARSLVWRLAIPVAVAVAVAVPAGLALDWLVLTLVVRRPMVVDAPAIAVLTATAIAAVLIVTALTLPALWRTTSLENLREE